MGCCCSKDHAEEEEGESSPLLGDKTAARSTDLTPTKLLVPVPEEPADEEPTTPPGDGKTPESEDNPPTDVTPAPVDLKQVFVTRYDELMEATVSRFHCVFEDYKKLQSTRDELRQMYPDYNKALTMDGCFYHVRNTLGDKLSSAITVQEDSVWIDYKPEHVHHSLLPAINTFNKASRLVTNLTHEGPQLTVAVEDVIFAESDIQKEIDKSGVQDTKLSSRNLAYNLKQFGRVKGMTGNIQNDIHHIVSEMQGALSEIKSDASSTSSKETIAETNINAPVVDVPVVVADEARNENENVPPSSEQVENRDDTPEKEDLQQSEDVLEQAEVTQNVQEDVKHIEDTTEHVEVQENTDVDESMKHTEHTPEHIEPQESVDEEKSIASPAEADVSTDVDKSAVETEAEVTLDAEPPDTQEPATPHSSQATDLSSPVITFTPATPAVTEAPASPAGTEDSSRNESMEVEPPTPACNKQRLVDAATPESPQEANSSIATETTNDSMSSSEVETRVATDDTSMNDSNISGITENDPNSEEPDAEDTIYEESEEGNPVEPTPPTDVPSSPKENVPSGVGPISQSPETTDTDSFMTAETRDTPVANSESYSTADSERESEDTLQGMALNVNGFDHSNVDDPDEEGGTSGEKGERRESIEAAEN